jgi:hypothetical protein
MKKILILIFCLINVCAHAQTGEEIFQQKKTQRKYLLEQIAQLKLYSAYLKKGYNIIKTGLTIVSDITDNEKKLHEKFFTALGVLTPALKTSPKMSATLVMQIALLQTINNIKKVSTALKAVEVKYVLQVCSGIVQNTENLIDMLMIVAENNRTDMDDKTRAEKIDSIYNESLENYRSANALFQQIQILAAQRKNDQAEINQIKKLYPIK